ncbi:MAG: hypothetical protein AAF629_32395 [Chloroflexota bacterium]
MKFKQTLLFVTSFLLCLTALLLNLVMSPQLAQAHPNIGITLTATSTDTTTGVPDPTATPEPDDETENGFVIPVQLGCNIICSTDGQPLQAQIDVQLIHPESGWVEAITISNQQQTNVTVPYHGEWEVHLISQPRYASTGDVSLVGNLPQHIGSIWTDSGLQVVSCPVNCLIPPPLPPGDLPQTGADLTQETAPIPFSFSYLFFLVLGAAIMLVFIYYQYTAAHASLLGIDDEV